jgi:hypothetical protein
MYKVIWFAVCRLVPARAVPAFALWLIVAVISSTAAAEDFCALTLTVTRSDGSLNRMARIQLVDESGHGELNEMMWGPTLKICDFGFGPHSLRVGTNECLPVTISNLKVVIGYPIHLNVVLNSCGYQDIMRNACFLYLRVLDIENNAVPGAVILLRPIPEIQPNTDAYGRYQGLFRGTGDVTVTKEGYEPGMAHVRCVGTEELDVKVTMVKRKARDARQ